MRPTDRDLMVARAVRDRCTTEAILNHDCSLAHAANAVGNVELDKVVARVLASLPEPADEVIAAIKPWPPEPANPLTEFATKLVSSQREPDADEMRAAREAANSVFDEPAEQEQSCPVCGAPEHPLKSCAALAEQEQAAHPHAKCINLLEEQHLANEKLRAEVAAARAEGARAERERIESIVANWPMEIECRATLIMGIRAAQDEHGGEGHATFWREVRLAVEAHGLHRQAYELFVTAKPR